MFELSAPCTPSNDVPFLMNPPPPPPPPTPPALDTSLHLLQREREREREAIPGSDPATQGFVLSLSLALVPSGTLTRCPVSLPNSPCEVQVWVGSKQKQLGIGSMALLHASSPSSALLLGAVALLREPLLPPLSPGGSAAPEAALLTFPLSPVAAATILMSALLGLAVSLSTFLLIGATSSLTYNVVGHVKSVIIITGGVVLFGETMPPKKVHPAYACLSLQYGTANGK